MAERGSGPSRVAVPLVVAAVMVLLVSLGLPAAAGLMRLLAVAALLIAPWLHLAAVRHQVAWPWVACLIGLAITSLIL